MQGSLCVVCAFSQLWHTIIHDFKHFLKPEYNLHLSTPSIIVFTFENRKICRKLTR
ncbi:hypothetical protein A2U01_0084705, partial [Trifolium medium]|nr:hypothetical protein [Trifolium medium]